MTLATAQELTHTHTRSHNTQTTRAHALVGAPAEVEQGLAGFGRSVVQPGVIMELCDCTGLISLHVFQVKAPNQEVVTPHMLRNQIDLHKHTHMRKKKSNVFIPNSTTHSSANITRYSGQNKGH